MWFIIKFIVSLLHERNLANWNLKINDFALKYFLFVYLAECYIIREFCSFFFESTCIMRIYYDIVNIVALLSHIFSRRRIFSMFCDMANFLRQISVIFALKCKLKNRSIQNFPKNLIPNLFKKWFLILKYLSSNFEQRQLHMILKKRFFSQKLLC